MIREYKNSDLPHAAGVWLRSGQAEYHYLSAFQDLNENTAIDVFSRAIQNKCNIWIYESNQELIGFLAMDVNFIDRLYVDPYRQRKGVGSELIQYAKNLYPNGLRLKTHQLNTRACAFYEKHDFVVMGYGVSSPPESMPDVEYRWS